MNEDLTLEQIADRLSVTRRTVERAIFKLKQKPGVVIRRVKVLGDKRNYYPPDTVALITQQISRGDELIAKPKNLTAALAGSTH